MLKQINDTTAFLKSKIDVMPEYGLILGTGLGALADEIETDLALSYKDIPNFPVSTVEGHSGKLIFGRLSGKRVVAMSGRFHYYEGYNMKEVTFPVRVMKQLDIKALFLSNASGGLNPDFNVSDLMIINDHINLFPDNPLRGQNFEELGPRFPDMSSAYDKNLVYKAVKIARRHSIIVHQGVYAGVSGPTFETPAEYRYIRNLGADAVGMSTVPEVIVAHHMKLPVFAVSAITDSGVPGEIVEISHEEVQDVAATVQPKMTLIIRELLAQL